MEAHRYDLGTSDLIEEPQTLGQTKKIVNPEEGPTVPITEKSNIIFTKDSVVEPAIRVEHPQTVYLAKKNILRSHQLVWYVLAIAEILLFFRFFFMAMDANPLSIFGSFTYWITAPIVLPFQGLLKDSNFGKNTFEWSTLIAMLVYLLIAWAIEYFFKFIKPVSPEEVEDNV